ncbi:type VII toxin-antitoxin system HepT family RNase toxin [Thermoanaerobacterium thermosaccharolyticum]|uniref:type VII toxin-antitoxin system HepT family RNase toxin n=1 Tax=Thermoanaerobacterium thermosaccharolyticum TaxID=1517 RepID=UPI003DAA1BFE
MLNESDKLNILKRIDFIQIKLNDLDEYKKLTYEEYDTDRIVRRNVERIIENISNALIDISKIIIVNENIDIPNSYREIILKLGEIKTIDEELAKSIAEIARLRNVLAHQYLDIKWSYVKTFITDKINDVYKFIDAVNKYVEM